MPAKGDRVTVYRVVVDSGYGRRPDRLAMRATVGTVRGNTIRMESRPLWNGCRVDVWVGAASLSAEDAITAYQREELAKIERWRKDIARAEANIDASRELAVKSDDMTPTTKE